LVSNLTEFFFNLKQHLDENILNPIVNVAKHATENDIIREGGGEDFETSENSQNSELLLELHEKRSDDPEKTEVEKAYFEVEMYMILCLLKFRDVLAYFPAMILYQMQ